MSEEFNKKRMFDNISFMLTEFGRKIGELETSVGVSPGYISRTSKEENVKPGIDFIVNVANALDVSLDTLLNVNMTELTPTEQYLVSFLEKLKNDTVDDKLIWNIESADSLNRQEPDMNGYVEHPLFSYETFFEKSEIEYPEEVSRVVMVSKSFDCHTAIAGECYNLEMKNHSILYIMNISKSVYNTNDINAFAKEIWMYKPRTGSKVLCSNKDSSSLAKMVEDLYRIVAERSKHPKISTDLRYIIDSFMNDDNVNDEEEDDMPF